MSTPEPRLESLLPDLPAPGALHEPAALWRPNEPESLQHAASVPASRTNPKPQPSATRP